MTKRSENPDQGPFSVSEIVDACALYSVSVAALICLGAETLKARRVAGCPDPIVGCVPLSELTDFDLDEPMTFAAGAGRDAGYGALRMALSDDDPRAHPASIFQSDAIQRLVSTM